MTVAKVPEWKQKIQNREIDIIVAMNTNVVSTYKI